MAELLPEQITVIIDTREQNPFDMSPMKMEKGTLHTGDYTVKGWEEHICVERKSLDDLVGCMTSGRDRFLKELIRIRAFPKRCVVVEASWLELSKGMYKSRLKTKSATNTITSWVGRFETPFMFCGTRGLAEEFTKRYLFHEIKRTYALMANFGNGQ